MNVRNLENIEFEKIITCFLLAFNDYFVEMPTDVEYYRQRWINAKVNFKLSYGMFEDELLVGFIIHAVDTRNGVLTAYNTGTGVLPEYRQKRIIQQLYTYAIPDLKLNKVEKCLLEVICTNTFAIKSYEAIDFKITRTLKCFQGQLNGAAIGEPLRERPPHEIDFAALPNQQFYTWDNQKNSIVSNSEYRFFQIETKAEPESYFIINDKNGYLAQFEIFEPYKSAQWRTLFNAIQSISPNIRINNVDSQFKEKIEFLKTIEMENTIDQFEMEMDL